jgi:tRNA-Thr(GGU) m(6)t(6)A37 methyltransferase TsaA
MVRRDEIRLGERAVAFPPAGDAQLVFIGQIRTPWTERTACPRQGSWDSPLCRIEVFEPWSQALSGVETYARLEVLYWLHRARRDLVLQSPRGDGRAHGTFSLRSPVRPNPIGSSVVTLCGLEAGVLLVRGLDCLDGTPLIDLKPDRALFKPQAPPTPAEREIDG